MGPRGESHLASHIALLRGINVNGRRVIPMARLRELAAGLGYRRVESYIQTGNVLLESPAPDAVRRQLEAALHETFGCDVAVAVRSPKDLERVLALCPYQPGQHEVVYVAFAVTPPALERRAAAGVEACGDCCTLEPTEVYILYRHGVHGSPLSNAFFERTLGVPMTSRNLRTVQKLVELARRHVDGPGGP